MSAAATPTARPSTTVRAVPNTAVGTLDGIVASLQPDASADYGLVVEDLGSGERVALNESRVFRSGSVYKLALAWLVLRQVDRSQIRLDQPLEIVDDDAIEGEPEGGIAPGETPSVGEALDSMFSVSSNAAAHALLRLVGRSQFNQAMDGLGLTQTRVPEEPDAGEAVTTADDLARLLRLIATEQGLSGSTQRELRRLLAAGGAPDALRETLDDDVRVLDKTGNLEDASNVGALLLTPRSTVILVVLDQGVDPGDARAVISQLGQAALQTLLSF
jgi:beta-lactamase class A